MRERQQWVDRVVSVSQRLFGMKIGQVKAEVHEKITGVLSNLIGLQ